MAYSEADKRDIALQNANNAAAAIIAGITPVGAELVDVLANFDQVRDHIFNGTRGVTATAVAPAPAAAGASAVSSGAKFSGGDDELLPLKADGTARFKGPQGKFVGKTLSQILASTDPDGRSYLEYLVNQGKDETVMSGVKAFLARHPA